MDVEYIALESTDEFLCQGIVQAIGKEIILVKNVINDGDIFIFDRNGKGLRKFNRKGQGSEEYIFNLSAFVDDNSGEIYIDEIIRNVLVYDFQGNFLKSIPRGDNKWINATNYNQDYLIARESPSIQIQNKTDYQRFVTISKQDGNIAKDAEKAKKAFAGQELEGKKLGVIGLGAIGVLVANAATHLGMDVYGYDPYVSVDSAWRLSRSIHHTTNVDEIYENCDYITVHVPALDSTKGMIGKDALGLMKEGVIVLNFARDVLVDSEAMVDALVAGKVKHYVTDFPTPEIAGVKGAIVIPHLGASTEESEDNCAKMAVKEVMDYLENGNIKHSVNYPDCDMGLRGDKTRILVLHHNVPNMIGQISAILAKDNMNIADLTNKSKGKYAYTMIDVDSEVPDGVVEELKQIGEVLRVRVIC